MIPFAMIVGHEVADHLANLAVLLVAFQLQMRHLITAAFLGVLARILLAAALMAVVVWPLARWLGGVVPPGTVGALIGALIPVVVGAGVYFVAARTLRLREATALVRRGR